MNVIHRIRLMKTEHQKRLLVIENQNQNQYLDNDTTVLLRRIYDACYDSLVPNSIPAAVLVLAKYQYQMAFVADQEINLLACLTEIMVECEFS